MGVASGGAGGPPMMAGGAGVGGAEKVVLTGRGLQVLHSLRLSILPKILMLQEL